MLFVLLILIQSISVLSTSEPTTCFTLKDNANYDQLHAWGQDTSSNRELAHEQKSPSFALSLRIYRKGTPLTLLLFNAENNKLLQRQSVVVARERRLTIPLKKFVDAGNHAFKLVVVNEKRKRNKVHRFFR